MLGMRTATTVFVAGSLLVFASCSSSSNDQTDGGGYAAFGNTGTGANNTGATGASNTGATGTGNTGTGNTGTGLTGTGAGTSSDCALGNACSTQGSSCVNADVQCTCNNGVWNPCNIVIGGSGGAGTGATGTGNTGTGNTSTGATGAGGGSTGDGGTAGQNSGTGGSCATADSAAKSSPQILYFVIDATGSMREIPASGSTNGQRKWDVLRTVWPELVDNLPDTWAVGMMEWACPTCPATAYAPAGLVPIAGLDATQRDALKNGLTADVMGGYTPTECAYEYALDQVKNWPATGDFVDAPRFIVLLTDGVPTVTDNCQVLGAIKAGSIPLNETQYGGLIATVAQGTLDTGISTFVGGVPGSDEPQGANYDPMYMLSLLAAAGGMALPNCTPAPGTMLCPDSTVPVINALGTAYCDQHGGNPQLTARGTYCHYDLTQGDFATGLRQALKAIKAKLVSCSYPVPAPPPPFVMVDTTTVKVIYKQGGTTDVELTYATANDCAQGGQWYYSEQDPLTTLPTKLDLCPDACTMVQSDLDASIDIRFECLGEV
jgi:hypothetical protein